jgi:hypothetical protein
MNLTEMRARVREDLQDTDSENYRWTNDEIDGAVLRVVDEYSFAAPIEQQDDISTIDDDTELDVSELTGLLRIESIEFPINQTPCYYQRFALWAGKVYVTDKGNGDDARVKWLKKHSLTAESTTIPAEHEEIIILGATGYLAMSAAVYTVDRASIAGRHATISFKAWGKERLDRCDRKLKEIGHGRRVIRRTFYIDE